MRINLVFSTKKTFWTLLKSFSAPLKWNSVALWKIQTQKGLIGRNWITNSRTDPMKANDAACAIYKTKQTHKQNFYAAYVKGSLKCQLHCEPLLEIYACPFFPLGFQCGFQVKCMLSWIVKLWGWSNPERLVAEMPRCCGLDETQKNNKANYTVDMLASVTLQQWQTALAKAVESLLHCLCK